MKLFKLDRHSLLFERSVTIDEIIFVLSDYRINLIDWQVQNSALIKDVTLVMLLHTLSMVDEACRFDFFTARNGR